MIRAIHDFLIMRCPVKRIAAAMVSILLLGIIIGGCTEKNTEGKTDIHFVTWKPNIPGVQEELIALFEKENPDIEVVREVGPHSSTAFHDLLTQKLKNRSDDVDVFLMDVIWPPEFAAAGWAMPIDDLFPQAERDRYLKGTILANTYKGKIYGVPVFIDSGMLYYRKDLLNEYDFDPPQTWDEMVEQSERITAEEAKKGDEIYGFSGQFKQYEGLVCDMMEYILSNGGSLVDAATGKVGLAEKAALEAVMFVRDRIIGKIAPSGVLTYQEPESLDLFIQGKAVFHRNWPYAWEVSNDKERSSVAGKVGITRLPHFDDNKSYAALGGWQIGISSHSQKKDAAWKFVRFYTSERIQKLLALKAGRAPTRKALYNDNEILAAHPHFSAMKDVFLTAYPRPGSPLYPSISNVLQRYFSKAISDPSLDLKKEASAASAEIEKIIAMTKTDK